MTEVKIPQIRKGLNANVLNLIQSNPELISKLVFASGKSYPTITRWVRNNTYGDGIFFNESLYIVYWLDI